MKDIILIILNKVYIFFLNRRYHVILKNSEILNLKNPLLILPNHPAFVDPQILFSQIYTKTKASPLVVKYIFDMPVIRNVLKLIDAIEVYDFSKVNDVKLASQKMHTKILNHLKKGKSIVLYPSGQTQSQGHEVIIGKQSAYILTKNLPRNTRVVGVRISGLWGSVWSRAWNGKNVKIVPTFFKSFFYLIVNLVFFLPKRKVVIEFLDITEEVKKQSKKSLDDFNKFLESFYNKNGEEKAQYIKHFFFAPKLKKQLPKHIEGSIDTKIQDKTNANLEIKEEIKDFLYTKISETNQNLKKEDLDLEKNLITDLRFDSLQLAEIVSLIQKKYNLTSPPDFKKLKTIRDLCLLVQNNNQKIEKLPKCNFKKEIKNKAKRIKIDKKASNIRDLFLQNFYKKEDVFAFDKLKGSIIHRDFLLKSIVASQIIKKITKKEKVGIMLPALTSTTMLITGTYLSKKTPVMFNWTVGKTAFRHCFKISDVDKILTAKTFFDKISHTIPKEFHERFVFVENEIDKLKISTKLKSLLLSKLPILLKISKIPKTAVVLFTSGSESLPKAVALSHKNIIEDLSGTLEIFCAQKDDIIVGILPPFHSFGFTATVILPLISDIRVVYSPDPTDGLSIKNIINHSKATLLPIAPTFLKILLKEVNEKDDLSSLKVVMTGAEACSKSLINSFKKKVKNAQILEGYGITECSPIVSITPRDKEKFKSVGKVIPTLEIYIKNLETGKKCVPLEEGMIYLSGASVFDGYLDKNIDNPFEKIQGKTFYKTGDIGYLDNDNYLFITGRLKRFVKIAGEMISLPFVEEILLQKYGSEEETVLALEAKEKNNKPLITCFCTKDLSLDELNNYLQKSGVSNIVKISSIVKIKEIPTLGSGKTDYKQLKKLLNA